MATATTHRQLIDYPDGRQVYRCPLSGQWTAKRADGTWVTEADAQRPGKANRKLYRASDEAAAAALAPAEGT